MAFGDDVLKIAETTRDVAGVVSKISGALTGAKPEDIKKAYVALLDKAEAAYGQANWPEAIKYGEAAVAVLPSEPYTYAFLSYCSSRSADSIGTPYGEAMMKMAIEKSNNNVTPLIHDIFAKFPETEAWSRNKVSEMASKALWVVGAVGVGGIVSAVLLVKWLKSRR